MDFADQIERPAPSHQASPEEPSNDDAPRAKGNSEHIPTSPSAIQSFGQKQNEPIVQEPTEKKLRV